MNENDFSKNDTPFFEKLLYELLEYLIKNNMYKYLIIIIFFLFVSYSYSNIWWIWIYTSKISTCIKENKSWSPLGIKSFLCIQTTSKEKIAFQIILDIKFKELDDEIEEYLKWLENNKDYYFWKNSSSDFIEAINDIWNKFWKYWYYWSKYNEMCTLQNKDWTVNDESILSEAILSLWWDISFINSKEFFESSKCMWLVELKLGLYEDVSYEILKLNKDQIRKDEKKLFIQDERKKNNMLSDLFSINIWYIEKIWRKWPSVTPVAK